MFVGGSFGWQRKAVLLGELLGVLTAVVQLTDCCASGPTGYVTVRGRELRLLIALGCFAVGIPNEMRDIPPMRFLFGTDRNSAVLARARAGVNEAVAEQARLQPMPMSTAGTSSTHSSTPLCPRVAA